MKLSVLVTVKDDARGLHQLLQALTIQEGPIEVVIVDASWRPISLTDTCGLEGHMIWRPNCTRGRGYQIAASHATGEILCFIGADDIPLAGWAHDIRRAFQDPGVDVFQGHNILVGQWPRLGHIPFRVDGVDIARPGCNTAYRRSSFMSLGGMNPGFQTAEDMDLNLRAVKAGLHFKEGGARVLHKVRPWGRRMKQAYQNGQGRARLDQVHYMNTRIASSLGVLMARPWLLFRFIAGYIGYRRFKWN